MSLTVYSRALALHDECAQAGFPLAVDPKTSAVRIAGQAPADLKGQLKAFLGAHEGRELSPEYRAMVRTVAAPSLPVRELLTLPVRYLGSYPLTYTARGIVHRAGGTRWAWTTSRKGFEALLAEGTPAFSTKELERGAWALEQGRAGARAFLAWCAHKVGRDWVLSPEAAGCDLPTYREGETYSSLTLGELLDGFSAELLSVELHEKNEAKGSPP